MVTFAQSVNAPSPASYTPPKVDSSWISNLYDNFIQGQTDIQKKTMNQQAITQGDQQTQLNAQRLAAGQQQAQLQRAFPNGIPKTPDGGIDYGAVASTLAKFGDVGGAMGVLQQQPPAPSPLITGQGAPQGQGGAPASIPARPLPPVAANAPQGDAGQGTIVSLVTDRLPAQNQTTGETIGKIAQVMGVDPNANLTPGQITRAQGLLRKYAPEIAGTNVGGATAAQPLSRPSLAQADASASNGGGGNLPPSAAAGTPAPSSVPQAPPASIEAGSRAQPAAPAPPQQQGGGAITPQVPLPKGFTDPQKAIMALRSEAARYAAMPNGKPQAALLEGYAQRIEDSIKPVKMGQYDTYVNPQHADQVVAQGPGAAALAGAGGGNMAERTAAAEVYRQTGKLPPNMGRGVQGAAEARAIRELAVEQEIAEGGNPQDWPTRWQSFGAEAAGRKVLETRSQTLKLAENEASTLIPRVREISAKINRTNYPTLNSLILAADEKRGGQDVVKLGIAVGSLIPVYARVLKPTGQITEGDTHRALEILNKAWSDGQINAALDQMDVELKSARSALDKTLAESKTSSKKADTKEAAPDKAAGKPATDGATVYTLPNGSKARVIEVPQ